MALAYFRMLIHKLLNKDPDRISEKYPLIILDRNSTVCMDNNGKYTNHTRHIDIGVSLKLMVKMQKSQY